MTSEEDISDSEEISDRLSSARCLSRGAGTGGALWVSTLTSSTCARCAGCGRPAALRVSDRSDSKLITCEGKKAFIRHYRESLGFNPSNAEATFVQKHKDAKIFEKHLNPVMLVFIR